MGPSIARKPNGDQQSRSNGPVRRSAPQADSAEPSLARTLAGNVQRLRQALAWSQAKLARESGLAKATVSMVEAGTANPSLATIEALAGTLGTTATALLLDRPEDETRGDAPPATAGPEPAAAESTSSRILDAVIMLYRKHGYEGTSMSAVANELDITAASLYYHYRSKEDLLFAAVHRALGRVLDNARRASVDPDPVHRLRALTRVHVDYQLGQIERVGPAAYGAEHLKEHLTTSRRRELTLLQRATFELMRDTIADGIRRGVFAEVDPAAAAFAVFGMCEHVMYWFKRDGALDRAALAELYGELAVRIVANRSI